MTQPGTTHLHSGTANRLFCREYGTAGRGAREPLFILHGLLGCSDNWHNVARTLAADGPVYVPDLRNHGRSFHSTEFVYEVLTEDVRRLLTERGIPRIALLGHSMGGKAAMLFACCHPECVTHLIVADIAPRAYPPTPPPSFTALLQLNLRRLGRREDVDAALAPQVPDTDIRQLLLKNLVRTPDGGLSWRANMRVLYDRYAELTAALALPRPFPGPTLFLCSGSSGYVTAADQPGMRELFPTCRFETIPDAGHWLHADAPDAFVRAARGFLAG